MLACCSKCTTSFIPYLIQLSWQGWFVDAYSFMWLSWLQRLAKPVSVLEK